jgi:hypothetical protein
LHSQLVLKAMGIPDPNLERYLIGHARERAAELLTSFVAGHAPDEKVDAFCARTGTLFDDYCDGLLDGLRNAVLPVDAAEFGWVREHYVPLMVEFATALRDTIADSATRHAAAQLIQCKVLEHERNLRLVVEPPASPRTASELASVIPDSLD